MLRLVAPRLEERRDELGVLLVVRRAEVMRPRRQPLHPLAQIARVQLRIELRFQRALLRRVRGGEPEHRRLGRRLSEEGGGEKDGE